MIQRIQTLYLLVVVILSVVTLFVPTGEFYNQTTLAHYDLNFTGISTQPNAQQPESAQAMSVWGLSVLMAVIPIVALASIFLYKKRVLQARLNVFNVLLMVGYYAMLFLYIWLGKQKLPADTFYWHIPASFQLVNIILSALAIRGILKDEALVRSLNRLR